MSLRKLSKRILLPTLFATFSLTVFPNTPVSAQHDFVTRKEATGEYNYVVFADEAKINKEIAKEVDQVIKSHKEGAEKNGLVSGGINANVVIDDASNRYLCFSLTSHDYHGGAHGMYFTQFYVYDKETKKRMAYSDFIGPLTEKQLFSGLLNGLVKITSLNHEYESPGPFADAKSFRVSQNFRLNADGSVSLVYPVYELDCYAAGELCITLDKATADEIRKLN